MNFLKLKRKKKENEKKEKKGKERKTDKIPESGSINGSSSSIEVTKSATNKEKRDDKENVEVKKNDKEISSTTSSPSSEQSLNAKNIPTPTSGTALTTTKKDNNHAHASKKTIPSNEIQESVNNDDNINQSKSGSDDKFVQRSGSNDNNDYDIVQESENNDDIIQEGEHNDDIIQEGEHNDDIIQEGEHNDDIIREGENNDNNDNDNDQSKSTSNESNDKFSNAGLGNVVGKAALQILNTSLLAAKPFFPWIESVTSVINEIVVQYETVEYNKKTCLVLVERVELINLSVKTLKRRRDENLDKFQNIEYYHSLIKLYNVLKLVKEFIFDISELKGYRRFIYASEVKNKANQLLQKLEVCCKDLQFSIIIARETREREQRSFDEDVANMTKFLKSIEKGVKTVNDKGEKNSEVINNIYDEVSVIRQIVTEINVSKTMFNAPKINPRDLDDEVASNPPKNNEIKVFKKLLHNTIPVACKYVSEREVKKMKAHLSILKSIQPSNKIIKFHGQSEFKNHGVLVFEWAEHGNLKDLYNKSPLSWIDKLNIAHDIASGLVFLQACKILHHDIRCENILITGEVRFEAKIANFKQSRELHEISIKVDTYDTIIRWLAPEKVPTIDGPSENRYTFKCEIFSFAMLLWELGAQKFPYIGMKANEIMDHVMAKKREKFDDFNSNNGLLYSDRDKSIIKGFRTIIESAWIHEQDQRPTINVIYQELDGLVGIHSPRIRPKSLSNDTINNAPSEKSAELELEDCKFIETILSFEEGLAAHREGKREKAWNCFEINATLGDPVATYWMAYYYFKGFHVKYNIYETIKYFKQAADSNVPEAQYYYAMALSKVKAKKPESIEYFTKAANNGEPKALRELGRIYYYGNGVEVNKEKGIQYLQLSALKKNLSAIKDLKEIDPSLLVVSDEY